MIIIIKTTMMIMIMITIISIAKIIIITRMLRILLRVRGQEPVKM